MLLQLVQTAVIKMIFPTWSSDYVISLFIVSESLNSISY